MLDGFGWGNYSPGINFLLMPVFADALRIQAIEFNDQIRKSAFSFMLRNNELKIFPRPGEGDAGEKVWFEYYVEADRNNPSPPKTIIIPCFCMDDFLLIFPLFIISPDD